MNEKIKFSDDQIKILNENQNKGPFHPFTCGSPKELENVCERRNNISEGILIATSEGWICPCGKYTQNWFHPFMAEPLPK